MSSVDPTKIIIQTFLEQRVPQVKVAKSQNLYSVGGHHAKDECTLVYMDFLRFINAMKYTKLAPTQEEFRKHVCTILVVPIGPIISPIKLIPQALKDKNIKISDDGLDIRHHEENCADKLLNALLTNWTRNYNQTVEESERMQKTTMYEHILEFISNLKQTYTENLRQRLAYDPKYGNQIDSILSATLKVLGAKPTPENILCFKHWCWLVKRKLHRRQTHWEMLLVFFSPQGGGKSSFLEEYLFKCFACKYAGANLSDVMKSNEIGKWTNFLVVNFDEFAKSTDGLSSLNYLHTSMKKLITDKKRMERPLYTHDQRNHELIASYCGTSNLHIAQVLCDPTGMRRYWQIETGDVDRKLRDKMDTFVSKDGKVKGWECLWKGIDEAIEEGYYDQQTHPLAPSIIAIQKEYSIQPILRTWFNDHYTKPDYSKWKFGWEAKKEQGMTVITLHELYREYSEYAEEAGHGSVSQDNFALMLKSLGIKDFLKSAGRKGTCYILGKPKKDMAQDGIGPENNSE